jgi:hypothetical protein
VSQDSRIGLALRDPDAAGQLVEAGVVADRVERGTQLEEGEKARAPGIGAFQLRGGLVTLTEPRAALVLLDQRPDQGALPLPSAQALRLALPPGARGSLHHRGPPGAPCPE